MLVLVSIHHNQVPISWKRGIYVLLYCTLPEHLAMTVTETRRPCSRTI